MARHDCSRPQDGWGVGKLRGSAWSKMKKKIQRRTSDHRMDALGFTPKKLETVIDVWTIMSLTTIFVSHPLVDLKKAPTLFFAWAPVTWCAVIGSFAMMIHAIEIVELKDSNITGSNILAELEWTHYSSINFLNWWIFDDQVAAIMFFFDVFHCFTLPHYQALRCLFFSECCEPAWDVTTATLELVRKRRKESLGNLNSRNLEIMVWKRSFASNL